VPKSSKAKLHLTRYIYLWWLRGDAGHLEHLFSALLALNNVVL
jgi:hypothetical protein